MVDRDHAALHRRRDRVRGFGGARVGVGRETVWQPICFRHDLVEAAERRDHGERTERLLMHDAGVFWHVGDDGWFEEVAFVADAASTSSDGGALLRGVADETRHRGDATWVG